jgi:uncharacterized membrane protein YkoI
MKTFYKMMAVGLVAGAVSTASLLAQADESDKTEANALNVSITLEQAVGIAKHVSPGTVSQASLSNDEGHAVWEIEIINSAKKTMDVEVDANTGSIVKNQLDKEDHEAKDSDHEDQGHKEHGKKSMGDTEDKD